MKKKKTKKAAATAKLSFGIEDEEEDGASTTATRTPRSMSNTPDIREDDDAEDNAVVMPKNNREIKEMQKAIRCVQANECRLYLVHKLRAPSYAVAMPFIQEARDSRSRESLESKVKQARSPRSDIHHGGCYWWTRRSSSPLESQ